ncbi:MAG: FkbM family methyltransferase [Bacteroidetes bacterium]|nr:MAG: FkbM family methyltransferase [Bacteroidota bacterium]PTM12249.1 MAG: FkbM family methyltransferase [Bacteroidota bacterium]
MFLTFVLRLMKKIRTAIDHFFDRYFPRGSKVKTIVLKSFLRDREKRFFYLIAPEDSVRTNSEPGYLYLEGWWAAWTADWFKDSDGNYTPWLTYPALAFLKGRIQPTWSVLEYGGGSSTLFWASRTAKVTTIEHNKAWLAQLKAIIPNHVTLIHQPLNPLPGYLQAAPSDARFDIIVIDGRERVACCQVAADYLQPAGIIILDDSQREKYQPGILFLINQGFRELPFWGLRHQATQDTCTSLFYRTVNCLGI